VNPDAKDRQMLALLPYLSESAREEKLLDYPELIKTPVVRNGRQAAIGYQPDVWKGWE
ncbi:MAG: ArsC family transcriptional regulator, partial [Peptococcaceae bacterium]|nr:ArsC family transcriptional regulator [Peptococcaceae bacterium]